MLERFEDKRVLRAALCRQPLIGGNCDVADRIIEASTVVAVEAGDTLMEQGGSDNDLYLIIAGSFTILVNGREVAVRAAEQHVGEMALIDPKSRRSAGVVAREDSVVVKISEAEVSDIASINPGLWKNLACELAERLRQRNDYVRQRNGVPQLFVGSSSESLEVANEVQRALAHEPIVVTVWTNGVFGPSEFPIEALERAALQADFAVLVLGPDDHVVSRKKGNLAPRDNVILELGLFIGAAGRQRVFLLVPDGLDVKIPTDVLGVTPVRYSVDDGLELAERLKSACAELGQEILKMGSR